MLLAALYKSELCSFNWEKQDCHHSGSEMGAELLDVSMPSQSDACWWVILVFW